MHLDLPSNITSLALAAGLALVSSAATCNAECHPEWLLAARNPGPCALGGYMAYDSLRDRVVYFGGSLPGIGYSNTTWTFKGGHWTDLALQGASVPAGSGYGQAAYDSDRDRVVMFGGFNSNSGIQGNIYEFDGTAWSLRPQPDPNPGRRSSAAFAYDSLRKQCVLFGGLYGHSFNDTWAWNGTEWTLLAPEGPAAPPAAQEDRMVYDAARDRIVYFAGTEATTWEWDGAAWALVSNTGPQTRFGCTMVYDSKNQLTILYGGLSYEGVYLNEIWTWNGVSWTQIDAAATAPRHFASAVFDTATGQMVMTGGSNAAGMICETLAFQIRQDADANNNGVVDFADLTSILSRWGQGCR